MNPNENIIQEELCRLIDSIEEGDMLTKQKNVLDRLGTIRVAKKKLLEQMKLLMEKEEEDELIQRLIQSYDGLKLQEDEFSAAFRNIIDKCFCILDEAYSKLSLVSINASNEETTEDDSTFKNEKNYETLIKLDNMKGMMDGAKSLFKEAEEAANLLDQQLKMRLEIHFELKKKKNILAQMQKKVQSTKKDDNAQQNFANQAINSTCDRKQRQLERLRKEAARRGIIVKTDSKQQESPEGNKPNPTEQIPPPVTELPELSEGTSNDIDLHQKILERFNSLENRKQRMQLVRSKLENFQRQKMDNTYEEALKRFNNLSEMRSKLEELQNVCAEVIVKNDEEEKGTESKNNEGVNRSIDDPNDSEDNHSSVSTNELLNEVRRAFNTAFNKEKSGAVETSMDSQTTGNMPCSSSFESAFSTLGDRLKVIENVLHNHTDQLVWIGNQCSGETSQQQNIEEEQSKDDSLANRNAEKNRDKAKALTAQLMGAVSNLFQEEFGVNKTKKIDEEFVSSTIEHLIIESCASCPPESHEKINESFPPMLDGVMSPYLGREFWQIGQNLIKELSEALESEITFILLIHNANALTI